MAAALSILAAAAEHLPRWGEMRAVLWPWDDAEDHAEQAEKSYLAGNPDYAGFVAVEAAGQVIGFIEATLRRDYVEGCNTSPVAFVEGLFVEPQFRTVGVARTLVAAVAEWGKARGCTELASNALLDNTDSHAFHAAIGFAETERVVFFRKEL